MATQGTGRGVTMRRVLTAGIACLLAASAASLASGDNPSDDRDWPFFGNDSGAQRFSPMDEINRDTVKSLKVAWTYNTGDSDGERPLQCTPIVVDGTMYLSTVQADIVALDPATGTAKWRYYTGVDPK